MSVKSKAQLKTDIQTFIADNTNEEIWASDVRGVLIDIVDSFESVGGGGGGSGFIQSDGFGYWKKANPTIGTDTTGDIREGMVGVELQLQEYTGSSWEVRSTR